MGFERLRGWFQARGSGAVRRTPTILQMEAVECGAAALAIVLAHFGRWAPLEELRTACGVTRDGSKASNMVKAARRYGLQAKGLKVEPEGLRTVALPAILHWNFNHFVVLEGFHKGLAYLNDPAYGPRKVSLQELDDSFTGVVLTFEPGPDLVPEGRPPRFWPTVEERLTGSRGAILFVVLAGLLLAVPTLVTPTFTKLFIDRVLLESRWQWLSPLLVAMALAALLAGALTWLQQTYLLRLETRLAVSGSSRFLHHVLRLPQEFFHQRFAGDISSRVAINDRVAQLLSRELVTNLLGVMTALTLLVLLLSYDVLLTLVGVAIAACNVLALRQVSRLRADGNRRLLQERGKLSGAMVGGLRMIETLKATGGESAFFARWAGYQAKVVNARQELELYTQMLDVVPPLLAAVNTAVILGLGSLKVIDGALTLGGLIAFQVLMAAFLAPIQRLVNLGATLQTVEGDLARLDDVLRHPAEPPRGEQAGPARQAGGDGDDPTKLSGHLELRGITFGYSPLGLPLLESFSLTVRPGRRVALVGGSGSGKSTVTKLILGLYRPWSGEILFDGRPLSGHSPRVFTASVAYVDQSSYLFAGSIRDNLTLWDPTAALPELVAAARDAEIHDDVSTRPGGYESAVEEGGGNFSGGQRQRLELARALVESPTLLILDEATSALDPATEQRIDENLRRRGCACLIVAHRLSTIRDADEIVVLEQGKVVERGRHDDLKSRGGAYARLIEAQ